MCMYEYTPINVYVWIHTNNETRCVYVCTYTNTYTCMYTYEHVPDQFNIPFKHIQHVCIHTYAYIHDFVERNPVCLCMPMYVHIQIHILVCTHTNTYLINLTFPLSISNSTRAAPNLRTSCSWISSRYWDRWTAFFSCLCTMEHSTL
jgi:hypothetical protein